MAKNGKSNKIFGCKWNAQDWILVMEIILITVIKKEVCDKYIMRLKGELFLDVDKLWIKPLIMRKFYKKCQVIKP